MKSLFLIMIVQLSCSLFASPIERKSEVLSSAYIKFFEHDGVNSPGGGILIGIHPNLNGVLFLENANHKVISELPVIVKFFEAGAILGLNYANLNSKMSLKNVKGKNLEDILGVYYGMSIGASLSIGFSSSFAYNKHGVFLSDFEGRLYGAGVNLNGLKLTIMPRESLE